MGILIVSIVFQLLLIVKLDNDIILSFEQREEFRKKVSSLMVTWSWNGVDLRNFFTGVNFSFWSS